MSKNKFVNIPPSVLALTQLVRLRVNNNPVMPHSFFGLPCVQTEGCGGGREREKGQGGRRERDSQLMTVIIAQS
jgi:hypothetical protein